MSDQTKNIMREVGACYLIDVHFEYVLLK